MNGAQIRSRKGLLADKAVLHKKLKQAEAQKYRVNIEGGLPKLRHMQEVPQYRHHTRLQHGSRNSLTQSEILQSHSAHGQ